ncbi:unnamed protein product [Thlaspi arvense]|uniref:Uncharacterized protein n=1 Tax=Thlaspi arvense TaxID=13288 RepID=A0AAU9R8L8_THLAR|nr:unnamed protein product [Thlaspi arvense]
MVDGEASFKRPGSVPFDWEIRPGVPRTRDPQPHQPSRLQPPKNLPPLRLKQLPPSNPPSPSLSSSSSSLSDSKTRRVSPFAPPTPLKPCPGSHSSGPPTPYWRSSSARRPSFNSGDGLRRWRFLKSLIGLKKSKSGDSKKTGEESSSSGSENFYDLESTFTPSSEGSSRSGLSSWGSPKSSFSPPPLDSSLKRQTSDLGFYVKKNPFNDFS